MYRKITLLFSVIFLFSQNVFSQKPPHNIERTTALGFSFININNVRFFVSNEGTGAADPSSNFHSGFYFPAETQNSIVFKDGIVWSGIVNLPDGTRILKAGGSTYKSGLQPGVILSPGITNGNVYMLPIADGSGKDEFKVYKIQKDWESLPNNIEKLNLEDHYKHWPKNQGAPFKNGKPYFMGDQVLFYVSNDMDSTKTKALYGSTPIGLEVQTTIYAFKNSPYQNSIFVRKVIINKSGLAIDSMYISQWSDPDVGGANDDLVGVDTLLRTSFALNGDNNDEIYGAKPPAVGYTFFQTPRISGSGSDFADYNGMKVQRYKNQSLSSFIYYLDTPNPILSDPPLNNNGTLNLNRNQRGLDIKGNPFEDNKGIQTKFMIAGNPVTNTGDIDGIKYPASDRRFLLSSGPFSMAPADTQEIIIGITVGVGSDRIGSLSSVNSLITQMSTSVILDVDNTDHELVNGIQLLGNYPNPFNPTTNISFRLAKTTDLTVDVYNYLGQKISTIYSGRMHDGIQNLMWNGKNEIGEPQSSGIYLYRISYSETVLTGKMSLLK